VGLGLYFYDDKEQAINHLLFAHAQGSQTAIPYLSHIYSLE
jgi:hypothetical protein